MALAVLLCVLRLLFPLMRQQYIAKLFADGLAYRLSKIWTPDKAVALKAVADQTYDIAARQNIETAQQYISPQIMGYFRP